MLGNLFSGLLSGLSGTDFKGGPISAVSNLLNDPYESWDKFQNGNTNEVNERSNQLTNQTNLEIASQNLGFQRENLEYQKALQQQIFDREDTAHQRTAQDMLSAGLNPLAMQGTNGAGEAIQTDALHNDFQHQPYYRQSAGNAAAAVMSLISSMSDMQTGNIQRDGLRLENDQQVLQNKMREAEYLNYLHDHGMSLDESGRPYFVEGSEPYTSRQRDKADVEMKERVNNYQARQGVNNQTDPKVNFITSALDAVQHNSTVQGAIDEIANGKDPVSAALGAVVGSVTDSTPEKKGWFKSWQERNAKRAGHYEKKSRFKSTGK